MYWSSSSYNTLMPDEKDKSKANWKFDAEEDEAPANEAAPPASDVPTVTWSGSEFIQHEKNISWYLLLGGAAAVIGGEMLLHGIEREHERRYDDDGGLLGGLGGIANDIGLF